MNLHLAHKMELPYLSSELCFWECRACGQLQCVQDEVMGRIDFRALGAEHQLAPNRGAILPARANPPMVLLGKPIDVL